jgi:biotin operon repressor
VSDGLRRRSRYTVVTEDLLRAPISDRALRLWILLDRYAGKDGEAFPSRGRLAKDLGCSLASVDRAIRELLAEGWLTIEHRTGTSNLYTVENDPTTVVTGDDHKEAAPTESSPTDSLFAEAAPPPSAGDRPESRTKRVNRLARHVCDSSAAVKARGYWRWKESVDGILIAHEDATDDQVLAALRVLLQSGLAINRDNAIRAYEGTLTVGRRVDNRHKDAVSADDPEQQARRAAWS